MIDPATGKELEYEEVVQQTMIKHDLNRSTVELMALHCEGMTEGSNVYDTRKKATQKARRLSAFYGERVDAFRCKVCNMFHVGKRVDWRKKR